MITRNRILFALGIWIVLQPFLGFPSTYKTIFIIVSGLGVVALSFMYARDKRMSHEYYSPAEHEKNDLTHAAYTESYPKTFASHAGAEESETEEEESYTDLEHIRNRAKTTRSF